MRSALENLVHSLSLDGLNEETGDVQHGRWYGRLDAPLVERVSDLDDENRELWQEISREDEKLLKSKRGGCIISQDSQGFISLDFYGTKKELDKAWREAEKESAEYDDEDEGGGDGDGYSGNPRRARGGSRAGIDSEAVAFFYKHAGYSVDTAAGETREQGHKRSARALAKAEAEAERVGLTFEWEPEQDVDLSWMDDDDDHDIEVESCIARDADGRIVASLGNITGADDNYRRVVEAELALEALP